MDNKTDNNIIYKYRSWKREHHANCLLKNELYFSSPKDMNDPFDLKIPANFSLLNTDKKILGYINYSISNFSPGLIAVSGDLNKLKNDAFTNFKNYPEKVQKFYESKDFERTDRHFGVLCFSEICNNVLMWSHYSDNHTGFCLGFSKQKLIDENLGSFGKVKYHEFPDIDPLDLDIVNTIIKRSYYKAEGWRYEREIRIVKLSYPEVLSPKEQTFIYPERFLKEIVLGLNINEENKSEIIKIGIQKNVPIYQIKKIPLSFDIERIQLTNYDIQPYL